MSSEPAPSHKLVPGCPGFLVDGFRHASRQFSAYFLSHAHSDHYTGLRESWSQGPIYCSETTAVLVQHMLGVSREWLRPLPLDTPTTIQGVEVTLVDANHCPGACQFLFALPDGRKFVHTGDVRYAASFQQSPHLQRFRGADALFLDTTYANPRYTFPDQEESIEYVASTIHSLMQPQLGGAADVQQGQQGRQGSQAQQEGHEGQQEQQEGSQHGEDDGQGQQGPGALAVRAPSRLFVISTYVIGKERILAAVRQRCGVRIYVDERKLGIMRCLDLAGFSAEELFTTNKAETPVHVARWGFLGETSPFFRPNFVNLEAYRQEHGVDEVIGFVPTGWLYEMRRELFGVRHKGACSVHLVPYSEHSSFSELQAYVQFIRPHKVIPTVGVGGEDAERSAAKMIKHFSSLVDETASKVKFLAAFHGKPGAGGRAAVGTVAAAAAPLAAAAGGGGGSSGARGQPGAAAATGIAAGGAGCSVGASAGCGGPNGCGSSLGAPTDDDAFIEGEEGEEEGEEAQQGYEGVSCGKGGSMGPLKGGKGRPAKRARLAETAQQAQQAQQGEVISLLEDSDEDAGPAATPAPSAAAPGRPATAAAAGPASAPGPSAAGASARTPAQGGSAEAAEGAPGTGKAAIDWDDQPGPSNAGAVAGPGEIAERVALRHLEAVLGAQLTVRQARQLLEAAGNDMQRAINMHLDGWVPPPQQAPAAAAVPAPTARSAQASPSAATLAAGITGRSSQPRQQGASGGRKPKRQKAGGAPAAGAGVGGQRSILSFFSAGAGKAAAQPASAAQPAAAAAAAIAAVCEGAGGEAAAWEAAGAQRAPLGAIREVENARDLASAAQGPGPAAGQASVAQLLLQPGAAGAAGAAEAEADAETRQEAEDGAGAESGLPAAGSPAGAKPKLVLPPPPASGSPGLFGATARQDQQQKAERQAQVPRDAVALPLDSYDPVGHAPWVAGEPTPYLHLARAFEAMDATTKRLRISDVLVNAFRSVLALAPQDLVATAYLLTGKVAPDYEGVELNVGGRAVAAAIQEATGVSRGRLHEMYNQLGDIGDVAAACKRTQATLQRPAPLTVQRVLSTLRGLAAEKGQGAAGRRQRTVLGLLRACRESETKYLTRTLVQALRVGANWRSVIPALAKAVLMHREGPKVAKAQLDSVGAAATAAFHVCPNLERLVGVILEGPLEELESRCSLTPGMPIKPMLAKISEGIPDALRQLKGAPFLAEYKYDGMRAQIHLLPEGQVKIFSRNCEDRSAAYPDVAAQIREAVQGRVRSLILDAELVAVERDPGGGAPRLKTFQELATRARGDVKLDAISVDVCVFAFDLLYRDGDSLLHLPLRERRAALMQALPRMRPGYVMQAQSEEIGPAPVQLESVAAAAAAGGEGATPTGGVPVPTAGDAAGPLIQQRAMVAGPALPGPAAPDAQQGEQGGAGGGAVSRGPSQVTGDATLAAAAGTSAGASEGAPEGAGPSGEAEVEHLEQRVHAALLEAFAAGTEGLMMKSLAGAYQPSKRSDHWVKLKRDYMEGMHDTFDLVPIGAWYGNGRKVKWFSPFLMAAYDPATEELQSICRCMNGFSDAFYREATARLKERAIPRPKPYYRTDEVPDVWLEPQEVWEVRGADLTLSPVHKAALGRLDMDRGVGLRFPRFLRVREDKAPEDATSADVIAQLYQAQVRRVVQQERAAKHAGSGSDLLEAGAAGEQALEGVALAQAGAGSESGDEGGSGEDAQVEGVAEME